MIPVATTAAARAPKDTLVATANPEARAEVAVNCCPLTGWLRAHGVDTVDVAGIATTVSFHADLVRRPEFARAEIHTRWVEEQLRAPVH